ncbi:MAG: hypothetical protein EXS05_01890 [Planctomycetaceae bacterium]|nr:hypothetical protein [Planctomycetaceae bacterium]
MTTSRKKPGIAFWLIVVAATTLLYVLSQGPAIWLVCKGYLPERFAAVIYSPLNWIVEQCPESTQEVRGEWASFWIPHDWEPEFDTETGEAIIEDVFKQMAEQLSKASEQSQGSSATEEAAGRTFSLPTKDGTLVVTIGDPDADVKVSDMEGKVSITRSGESVPITIAVNPGTHRLRFQTGTSDLLARKIVIEPGGKRAITAVLVLPDSEPDEQ